ncbi:hypothetical protein NC651_004648 [Populus alba x Populus x berolinensis]|nr:hypothetical protein NC651_004648 [Populus alba x Populus x berolinensis]
MHVSCIITTYICDCFLINLKLTSNFFSYRVFHLAINTVLFQKPYKDKYTSLERKLKRGMRMAELYEPYVFFKGM